jgi:pilus assembly protein CpaE
MQPKPAQDPFDLDFEADDEFAKPPEAEDAWHKADIDADGPVVVHDDPFVGIARSPEPEADPFPPAPSSMALDPADAVEPIAPAALEGAPSFAEPSVSPMGEAAYAASMPEALLAPSVLGEAVAPRITINAFCADQASDRRMERAKVVTPGGRPGGAVEFYQNQPTPSLLVVETLDPTGEAD